MYFPILRGRQHEFRALISSAPILTRAPKFLPIIEPVANSKSTQRYLKTLAAAGVRFGVIVNPRVGPFSSWSIGQINAVVITPNLSTYAGLVPTMIVDRDTKAAAVKAFTALFPQNRAVYYIGEPDPAVAAVIAASVQSYALFLRSGGVSTKTRTAVALAKRVDIFEAFDPSRASSNAILPDDQFFSDSHYRFPDSDFTHFGDYSILSSRFSITGFAPFCLAIHSLYVATTTTDLRTKHYKSDSNTTRKNPAMKYSEALAKLIADVPLLGPRNTTGVTGLFQADHISGSYPGLGILKERGIVRHIELMDTLI